LQFSGGVLSGTPTAVGTFAITFTAHNGIGSDAVQHFTLTVLGFHITTTSLPNAVVGTPYSQQLQSTGQGTATVAWKKVSLPKGFALSATGLLTGTPPATDAGPSSVAVTASIGKGATLVTVSATIPIVINEAPVFGKTSAIAAAFSEGSPGTATVTASGYPAPTITESGALPAGVTFANGVLSGTPAVTANSEVYNLTVTAANGISPSALETFSLTVFAPLVVTSPSSLPAATHATPYGPVTFTASGGAAGGTDYTWKKVSLPKGLAVSSTGQLSGTPKSAGSYSVQIEVDSKDGKTKVSTTVTLSLTVN
jgi:hypothetical protein